tara:strand:- start:254 stop:643 length:390 start_codon:yes stop_codon:yes gene_type:complete
MVVTTTMTVSGAVLFKAGENVNAKVADGSTLDQNGDILVDLFIVEAESNINVSSRFNFTDEYASLNEDVKRILNQIASDLAAMQAIAYDMSGYTSRTEAEDMINVLRDAALRGLSILRDKKPQTFMKNA